MIALRRWFVLVPGTFVESRMRNAIYKQLQELPVSFHDRWPSGQLLSRMLSDLNLIRRWISFGLVLLVVNIITILIGFVFLLQINWMLGVDVHGAARSRCGSSATCSRRSTPWSLAAARTRPATSRRPSRSRCTASACSRRSGAASTRWRTSRAQAEELRGTEIEKARAIAGLWLWLVLVPDVDLRAEPARRRAARGRTNRS